MNWDDLLRAMQQLDERDISDQARWWAASEPTTSALPTNRGEWEASLEIAFHAGQLWGRHGT